VKRFYKAVAAIADGEHFAVALDGRPGKTPERNPLLLPNAGLADAIVAEWDAQGGDIDPQIMPLTGLAQGALDQVTHERDRIVSRISGFADSDMLYFRADETQQALIDYQAEQWDPLLDWAGACYDVSFDLVFGIIHRSQAEQTNRRLAAVVEGQDDFTIAAMLSLVGLTGSLVATLALVEKAFDPDVIWPLVNLEELWQEEQWGRDDLAVATRDVKRAEFLAAVRFMELVRV